MGSAIKFQESADIHNLFIHIQNVYWKNQQGHIGLVTYFSNTENVRTIT